MDGRKNLDGERKREEKVVFRASARLRPLGQILENSFTVARR